MAEVKRQHPGRLEYDPKFAKFSELYVRGDNALRAAINAGYSEKYARSHSHELARRTAVLSGSVLKAQGTDLVQMMIWLREKLRAKKSEVRWNAALKQYQHFIFENTNAQLKAAELVLKCLDAFPAKHRVGGIGKANSRPVQVTLVTAASSGDKR